MMNYYDILGVPRTATTEQIKKAKRDWAKELYPRTGKGGDPEKFKEMWKAAEVLEDPIARAKYDKSLDDMTKNLIFHPLAFHLGKRVQGSQIACTTTVTKVGSSNSPVKVLLLNKSIWFTRLVLSQYDADDFFPIDVSFVIDTDVCTKSGMYQDVLLFQIDGKEFSLPISFELDVPEPTQLDVQPDKMNLGEMEIGGNEKWRYSLKIENRGGPVRELPQVNWARKQLWLSDLTVTRPASGAVFPIQVSFVVDPNQLSPGKQEAGIVINVGRTSLEVPVSVTASVPEPPEIRMVHPLFLSMDEGDINQYNWTIINKGGTVFDFKLLGWKVQNPKVWGTPTCNTTVASQFPKEISFTYGDEEIEPGEYLNKLEFIVNGEAHSATVNVTVTPLEPTILTFQTLGLHLGLVHKREIPFRFFVRSLGRRPKKIRIQVDPPVSWLQIKDNFKGTIPFEITGVIYTYGLYDDDYHTVITITADKDLYTIPVSFTIPPRRR